MPLFIINEDITKLKVDAIISASNNDFYVTGGVCGKIHRVAGPELLEECKKLNGCETGEAKITKGFKLPAKFVIHTVGPIWQGGKKGEDELLKSCYNNSLKLAVENKCKSIAFPMISTGVYGYPKYWAMKIAQSSINDFLGKLEDDIDVYIVLYGKDTSDYFDIERGVKSYLDFYLTDNDYKKRRDFLREVEFQRSRTIGETLPFSEFVEENPLSNSSGPSKSIDFWLNQEGKSVSTGLSRTKGINKSSSKPGIKLEDALNQPEESFSSMVMRKIKEKGINEVECYKAANVNKQIFSKIRSSAGETGENVYQPNKNTALSFAVALKLPLDEANELLGKAGYTFSKSNKTDIIVKYCIENHINDIFKVNDILFTYHQPSLGSKCY